LLAADVPANGARLFPIRLPQGHALVLGVNGTPLLQMSVYAADGRSLAPRGPLRVVNLGVQDSSPVQLLVTNEGVAPSRISLSLRADPTVPEPPTPSQTPPGAPGAPGTPAGEAVVPGPGPLPPETSGGVSSPKPPAAGEPSPSPPQAPEPPRPTSPPAVSPVSPATPPSPQPEP
jgi:serine/threonine-protein kinase